MAESLRDGFKPTEFNSDSQRINQLLEIYSFLEYGNREDMEHFRESISYYTGTGQDLPSPYEGWYMKIGSEWVRIQSTGTSRFGTIDGGTLAGFSFYVVRGQYGTEIVEHSAGEEVLIYSGEPPSSDI